MKRRRKAAAAAAEPALDPGEAAERARLAGIKCLARRDFAAGELAARLTADGHPPEAVAAVMADFTARRFLDDSRFATHYVAYHAQRGHGPRRIALDLVNRGVAQGHIDAALAAGPDWAALAREVRARRFGPEPPPSWAEKARQGRFLQYRGFSSDHIRTALGPDFELEDPP